MRIAPISKQIIVAIGLTVAAAAPSAAADPTVVTLTQVACQFVESENGVNHGYTSNAKADCEAINAKTGAERLQATETLVLEPGKYVFRVTNKDVPYEVGFWLRGDGVVARATLPSVSGGGLTAGTTDDFEVELKAGEYVYSCPLNPTLNYKLVVQG